MVSNSQAGVYLHNNRLVDLPRFNEQTRTRGQEHHPRSLIIKQVTAGEHSQHLILREIIIVCRFLQENDSLENNIHHDCPKR